MGGDHGNFIGGRWRPVGDGEGFVVQDVAGAELTRRPRTSAGDLEEALGALGAASGAWWERAPGERAELLLLAMSCSTPSLALLARSAAACAHRHRSAVQAALSRHRHEGTGEGSAVDIDDALAALHQMHAALNEANLSGHY